MADVMISAGEASGDLHGANLARALRAQKADVEIVGMGSSQMASAGVELLFDSKDIGVVGLVEVLKQYSKIKSVLKNLQRYIDETPPKVLVLIDYVEFNLKLAKYAKDRGVKVLFYVSPQVWAWREGRVPKIGAAIDHMAVIFPFEVDIYQQHNIPVTYVGHPLADEVHPSMTADQVRATYHLDSSKKLLALLPGSRVGEIERNLPTMVAAAKLVKSHHSDVQFVIPVAPTLERSLLEEKLDGLDVTLVDQHVYDVLSVADSSIVASGTATLQTALLQVPMSIMYRVAPLTYWVLSKLVKVDHIGLANIVAGHEVVPEFIQHNATPEKLAEESIKQLFDDQYNADMRAQLGEVKEKIGAGGCSERVAKLALDLAS